MPLTIIDNSKKDEYHTQINNRRYPFSACNVTSGIMFLKSNGVAFNNPTDEQDEDYFMFLMRSRDAYEKMEELASWTVRDKGYKVTNWLDQGQLSQRYKYPPSEVWQCLEWGINRLAGQRIGQLRWGASLWDLFFEIAKKRTVMTGGKWLPSGGGHFNVTVGLVTSQTGIVDVRYPGEVDVRKIREVIVDDPYGDFNTGYNDHRGNSVHIKIEDYLDHVAAYRNKAYVRKGVIWGFFKV